MENIYELNSTESELSYIQSFAPAVFERIRSEMHNGDVHDFKKYIIIKEAVLEAFEISGKDAIVTTEINGIPAIKMYLTKKSTAHINGRYKIVEARCFSKCKYLETLIFEEGVEWIEERVMYNNPSIKRITFPRSLKYIGEDAFLDCVNLTDVVLLNPQTRVSPNSFGGTKWFEQFTDDFVAVNGQLLKYNGSEEDVIIPEGIIHISHKAFYDNENIRTVRCPSTLEGIWTFSFTDCINLQKVYLNENLKIISIGAFEGCTNLTEINLPKSLEELGAMAFDRRTVIGFYDTDRKLTEHIEETYPMRIVLG